MLKDVDYEGKRKGQEKPRLINFNENLPIFTDHSSDKLQDPNTIGYYSSQP